MEIDMLIIFSIFLGCSNTSGKQGEWLKVSPYESSENKKLYDYSVYVSDCKSVGTLRFVTWKIRNDGKESVVFGHDNKRLFDAEDRTFDPERWDGGYFKVQPTEESASQNIQYTLPSKADDSVLYWGLKDRYKIKLDCKSI